MFGLIGAALSAAAGSVASFIGSVSGAIGSALTVVATALKTYLPIIEKVVSVISTIANALGVYGAKEDPVKLGMRATMSDKKPEDFNSHKDYINYIKNEVKIDEEKLKNLNDVERVGYTIVGSSVQLKGIEENKGFAIDPAFFGSVAAIGMEKLGSIDGVNGLLDKFGKEGRLGDFADYAEGKLQTVQEKKEIANDIVSTLKSLNPDIEKNVADMYGAVTNDLKTEAK